jgi:hypothetical protein
MGMKAVLRGGQWALLRGGQGGLGTKIANEGKVRTTLFRDEKGGGVMLMGGVRGLCSRVAIE